MPATNLTSILETLSRQRLVELGRDFQVAVRGDVRRREQVESLLASGRLELAELLRSLGRDELKAVCRRLEVDDSGRARAELAARISGAVGASEVREPPLAFGVRRGHGSVPHEGDIVRVRHRQYLVEQVFPPPEPGHATRLRLCCLDDDDQGRTIEVLWELELGAQVLQPETEGLGLIEKLDEPRHFAAYLHALKWNAVTASDARLFQSPFRAGIRLFDHQLAPLMKALSLPRANLFVADDVGLGKTVESGLVLQELILRQQVEWVLIVCPAAICLQWRGEMEQRFGLQFEIYNREFIARRRQERGFQVNPWGTHRRFIISYQTLRRPEYRDPLLQHLGDRARKSLLILDEAHTAAPASAAKYAIDSRITQVIRELAPRFEHRLFLSATPHNGHSNSFSSLLEILDPQRFTRGVPVQPRHRDEIMVRRLKSDLRRLGVEGFPERVVVQMSLLHAGESWTARVRRKGPEGESEEQRTLGEGSPAELELSEKLGEYTDLMKPTRGRGKLTFIRLQQRLLSSVEAFYRTLQVHEKSVGSGRIPRPDAPSLASQPALPFADVDEDEYGPDEEDQEVRGSAEVAASSREVETPEGKARRLLDQMLSTAERARHQPDAKCLALIDWIRRHQCPAVQVGGVEGRGKADLSWSDRRVIIFTEFADTKRYLLQVLQAAVSGTEDGERRVLQFHGGMGDAGRDEVQRAFNSLPHEHPVRILIATDAAREGVNLQGHCADLFHYDVPWNPARMEQRNGRIDRTLQAEPEVRCHYFFYPQRRENLVLEKLVEKVERIHHELGSLGTVIMDRLERVLDDGIDERTLERLDAAEQLPEAATTVQVELESSRTNLDRLAAEIREAGQILNESRDILEFEPRLLADALDVALELAQQPRLLRRKDPHPEDEGELFQIGELGDSWQPTLDGMRPPRGRDEPFWEWRRRPPQPVVFTPPRRMNSGVVQLHLQHPFVRRLLGRFLAQGYSAHDLSRVTVVRNPHDALVRVIAFGRLSLFGKGAVRLHDQLISVAAQWLEAGGAAHLRPFAQEADRKALDRLEEVLAASPTLERISPTVRQRLQSSAAADLAALWSPIRDEADSRAHEVERALGSRGREEADLLRQILESQRADIQKHLKKEGVQGLLFEESQQAQRDQLEQDERHMRGRLDAIAREIQTEPAQIEELYQVVLRRLEPVGLVYLWPETRG